MALAYERYVKSKNKEVFLKNVIIASNRLGIEPDWLMHVMYCESHLNYQEWNLTHTHYGLIQFSEDLRTEYEKDLNGVSFESLTDVEQLNYVYNYLTTYRIKLTSLATVHMAVMYPQMIQIPNWKPYDESNRLLKNNGVWTDRTAGTNDKGDNVTIESFTAWTEDKFKTETKNNSKKPISKKTNTPEPTPTEEVVKEEDMGWFTYIHTVSSVKTLKELIEYKGWVIPEKDKQFPDERLLNFEDNIESIRLSLAQNLRDSQKGNEKNSLEIGTRLKIPVSWASPMVIPFDGLHNVIPNDQTSVFISNALKRVVESPEYRIKYNNSVTSEYVTKKMVKPRVWIYCKTLGIQEQPNKPRFSSVGAIFDLSPFVINVTTNVGKTGGSFSIVLPPLMCEVTSNGWEIKKSTINTFNDNGSENFIAKSSLTTAGKNWNGENTAYKNQFLFKLLISENDIVWISLDNPQNEPNEKLRQFLENKKATDPIVDRSLLAGNFYDMIGLVDSVPETMNPQNAQMSITVQGRDLMKLLIEDSSQYMMLPADRQESLKTQGLIKNDNPENWGRPFRMRLDIESEIWNMAFVQRRTIGEMLGFIISSMATVELAPDDLFDSYVSQETEDSKLDVDQKRGFGISRYNYYDLSVTPPKTSLYRAAGIWQIIKLQIDNEAVNDRTVLNHRLAVHSGSLISGMKMFADDLFVELFGDTYIDQYFLIARRPPFNYASLVDYAILGFDYAIKGDMVTSDNLDWYKGDVYSWYRINLPQITPTGTTMPYTVFPVVYFREFCEIWGNKSLDVQSNYTPWNVATEDDVFSKQMIEDLKYLVQSHVYLPFTREGSITIKGGDRRFKRGTWVRYELTREIYYIDNVQQSVDARSGDRFTMLRVSRGMVENNDAGNYILPLYFNIIDGINEVEDIIQKHPTENVNVEPIKTILELAFDSDESGFMDVNRQFKINVEGTSYDEQIFDTNLTHRKYLRKQSDDTIQMFVDELHEYNLTQITLTGNADEVDNNGDVNSRSRAKITGNEIIKIWNQKYPAQPFDESKIIILGNGKNNLLGNRSEANTLEQKKNVDYKNRRIDVVIYTKDTKPPPKTYQSFDFSKWKVNQGIFNFFKTRSQFRSSIEDFMNIGKYTEGNKPTDFKDDEQYKTEKDFKNGVDDLRTQDKDNYIKDIKTRQV